MGIVERDATTLFTLRPPAEVARARIDPASVDDPGCREVLDRFERAGVAVAIWDTTTDVGIPEIIYALFAAAALLTMDAIVRACRGKL